MKPPHVIESTPTKVTIQHQDKQHNQDQNNQNELGYHARGAAATAANVMPPWIKLLMAHLRMSTRTRVLLWGLGTAEIGIICVKLIGAVHQ